MATGADAAELTQHVLASATRKAGHQYASIALPNRKTWFRIIVGWASAHGDVAAPAAAQSADEIDKFLGWTVRYQRHDLHLMFAASLPLSSSAWRAPGNFEICSAVLVVGSFNLIRSPIPDRRIRKPPIRRWLAVSGAGLTFAGSFAHERQTGSRWLDSEGGTRGCPLP
jgi:hypothetical protein